MLARLRPDIFCQREAGSKECAIEEEQHFDLPPLTHVFKVLAVDFFAMALAAASGFALWRWNTGVHILVIACGAVGAVWSFL
ncbi:hypothetical protein [Humidesulfovibrio sp.]